MSIRQSRRVRPKRVPAGVSGNGSGKALSLIRFWLYVTSGDVAASLGWLPEAGRGPYHPRCIRPRVDRLGARAEASDGDVVRAVLAGDAERYAELVRRYRDRYARYATRMLGSSDAAEDAVQDAFIRAYDQLAQCRDPDNFAGWFFLILRNRCFAERRRTKREAPADVVQDELPGPGRADHDAERSELQELLARGMGELTAEQREVFVLKHVEGKSYEEIAAATGATVASLKMRMHRAYDRLRGYLKERT